MLSIVWGILKVIGMVLLIILCLLLTVLLLMLFVPLRYELTASGEFEKEAETAPEFLVKARVSWLLRLVCICLTAGQTGLKLKIRMFGIPLGSRKKKRKEPASKTASKTEFSEMELSETELSKTECLKTEFSETNSSETECPEAEMPKTASSKEETPEFSEEEEKASFFKRLYQKFKDLIRKILEFFRNLRCTFEKICVKIKKAFGMAGEILDFMNAEENRESFRYLKEEAGKLLRHILPQKLFGHVAFGLEDPAATGKVLMALGMIYPLFGNRISITPLFENQLYVEGNIYLKGRIRVFSLLIIVVRVWLNKRFRGLMKRSRELKEQLSRI